MNKKLFYDKVQVGYSLPTLIKQPTSRQLVLWAGASGDYQEIHYDKEYAKTHGLPNIIVHGQLECSFLDELLFNWKGNKAMLKELRCAYQGINLPGSYLYCKGKVTKKYIENGNPFIRCDVWIENESGETTVTGEALLVIKKGA